VIPGPFGAGNHFIRGRPQRLVRYVSDLTEQLPASRQNLESGTFAHVDGVHELIDVE
jgi:hypothetical protein